MYLTIVIKHAFVFSTGSHQMISLRPGWDRSVCQTLWNTTRRRLGLGLHQTVRFPLFVIRKPTPTVTGDHPAIPNAQGFFRGGWDVRRRVASPSRAPPPL